MDQARAPVSRPGRLAARLGELGAGLIPLLAGVALADPAACDPSRNTGGSGAVGFCLTEDEYVELGRLRAQAVDLRSQVAARDAELQVFDAWKAQRDAAFASTVAELTQASTTALAQADEACNRSLDDARKRSPLDRHGFALGLIFGTAAAVGTTALVLDAYGKILD